MKSVYPIIEDDHPVKLKGETLDALLWQGVEWSVTTYGLEKRNGQYPISIANLKQTRDGLPNIVLHMAEKGWVNPSDFATAFMVAITLHDLRTPKDAIEEAFRYLFATNTDPDKSCSYTHFDGDKCVAMPLPKATLWKYKDPSDLPRRPIAPLTPEKE